ncbi:unnamed protein product [Diabrotica balteata]|uniref:Uncharacterized protein n=1 Tax=Diabrotica balteata TaxID=107213 RepID=A0A9N9TE78_DIABA|nr:unnamed protein product [Diabrotica balteata]
MSSTTETIPQENKSSDLGATVLNISKEIKWKFLIVLSAMPNYMSWNIKNVKKYLNGSHPIIKQTADNYFSMKEHQQFKDQSLLDALPRCLKQDIAYDLNCGFYTGRCC